MKRDVSLFLKNNLKNWQENAKTERQSVQTELRIWSICEGLSSTTSRFVLQEHARVDGGTDSLEKLLIYTRTESYYRLPINVFNLVEFMMH